jgi:8-oxo-dGTP pyrophosphatase MutT (NUDIX family)
VISVKFEQDEKTNTIRPFYLMVQRKDSLSYVEFLRGKYGLENRSYIMKLFNNMTKNERMQIESSDFDTLWKLLWQISDCSSFYREYNESKSKFSMLKKGYHLKSEDGELKYFDLKYCIHNATCSIEDTEWGFPKGRRNINEDDVTCAFREFQEETGIPLRYINLIRDIKPFEEVFSGSNHVRYKHIYYLAAFNKYNWRCNKKSKTGNEPRNNTCKEIKKCQWFTYEDAQANIPSFNVERRELFKRVNQLVMKQMSMVHL